MGKIALILLLPLLLGSCGDPAGVSHIFIENRTPEAIEVELFAESGASARMVPPAHTLKIETLTGLGNGPTPARHYRSMRIWKLLPDRSRRAVMYTQDPIDESLWKKQVIQNPSPGTLFRDGVSGVAHYTFSYNGRQ